MKHQLKRKARRSQLIAGMEAAARRLSRYAEKAGCDLNETGIATSLRGFALGLRQLADFMGERRMTMRPSRRSGKRPTAGASASSSKLL